MKKGICALVMLGLVIATVGQAVMVIQQPTPQMSLIIPIHERGGSVEVWQDDFFNLTKIDPVFSQNILVNTTLGTISMQGTYPAWVDPAFPKMKPIMIVNNGQETFQNYIINITVLYDADMQSDFDDVRFTDGTGVPLSYYIQQKSNGFAADILVKVPTLLPGQKTIYMFYGNPTATNQSNFAQIFTWSDRTCPDTMISFKATTEGAWDPDVEYGDNRFFVAWEERLGPEDINIPLSDYQRTIPGVIHGRTYNKDGQNPVPDNNSDIDVSDPSSSTYHAENPSVAFGAGKFFVAWEENPANQPLQRYDADIKGALVNTNGEVTMRFSICVATSGQFNPQVAYDATSNRFLVVWADARNGWDDYDVRGRLYTADGYPLGTDFPIAYETYYQGSPWVSSDNQGYFFIVYEDGTDAQVGPFSLYAYRYDSTGIRIGGRISIASGTATVDYIFPAVSYNKKTGRYFITWNDGDVSVNPAIRDSYDGNIWGKILSRTGTVVKNNYIIEAGTSYICANSIPYFESMFFVVYDGTIAGNQDIYGRLIASDGSVMTGRQEISDGSSLNVDWNNLAVGDGRIFATWEDERDQLSAYADTFGYVWRSVQTIGSLNVSCSIGSEQGIIWEAQVMSIPIHPELFREWREFFFVDSQPDSSTIVYDIMDENGTIPLVLDIQNGQNISTIIESTVRLRASFFRVSPSNSPVLDTWNISAFVGKDIYEPITEVTLDPAEPNGNNNWYVTPVTATFTVSDVDSDPWNITTYYDINGFGVEEYDPEDPPMISHERPDNSIEYWSNDSFNEELPHKQIQGIQIDLTAPMI
ncbi:MAG: DUF2341 domain-containing protein, partial [Candidatus Thermoplasmatota archaeon]|nr:DUF2341 domain-containing protein [Candidatus Thermoplasmatota archaeon]